MQKTLQPNVAGTFYPDDGKALSRMLDQLLGACPARPESAPKALVAPHAGYIYSGPIAASAYAQLQPDPARIRRVILLAPSHYTAFAGVAMTSAETIETPLGRIPVDVAALDRIRDIDGVKALDAVFDREHALEVQLPFLQQTLHDFKLVPLLIGDASPEMIATLLDALWGDDATLIVVSTDLSHFLDYDRAMTRDTATSRAITALQSDRLGPEDACGCRPLNGLLLAARRHGLQAEMLDLRNSGDTAGSRERVVGYGAYAFR